MVRSIGVTSYVQDVSRLTDEVARVTSSGYVRGSRATSFSTVRLVARASSCPSHICPVAVYAREVDASWTSIRAYYIRSISCRDCCSLSFYILFCICLGPGVLLVPHTSGSPRTARSCPRRRIVRYYSYNIGGTLYSGISSRFR